MTLAYPNLIDRLAGIHQDAQRGAFAAVNQALTWRNWLIGAWIFEYEQGGSDRATYGARLLERLAEDLGARGVTACSFRSLKLYRQVALAYSDLAILAQNAKIGQNLSAQSDSSIGQNDSAQLQVAAVKNDTMFSSLMTRNFSGDLPWRNTSFLKTLVQGLTWSHLVELAKIDQPLKRAFYEVQALKEGWIIEDLRRQVNSLLFERVGLSKDQDLVMDWARTGNLPQTPEVMIRDPYILEFTGLKPSHSWHEEDLEQALIDHLQDFLLELGTGFCFVARQYRITIANKHHHLDLLFYHRHLRCLVAIDLKIGTFDHSDAGQMNLYLNFLRENATRPDENPPVGLLLCAGKDEEEVHYATTGLDQKLFVSRYLVELPSEERLRLWLHQEQEVLTRIAAKHEAER